MNDACFTDNLPKAMKDVEKERALFAKEVYCKACEENGIKVCTFESFPGWREYVEGEIGESELSQRAQEELADFRKTFFKYTIIYREEEQTSRNEDEGKKHRQKAANKIYQKLCKEYGLRQCFFTEFNAWSEYVQGRLGEAEFMERARQEAAKMLQSQPDQTVET
jgi:hypothetical protein